MVPKKESKDKEKKKETKKIQNELPKENLSQDYDDDSELSSRCIQIEMTIDCTEPAEEFLGMTFQGMFQGQIYVEGIIENYSVHNTAIHLDIRQPQTRAQMANNPLVLLLKGKTKDTVKPSKGSDSQRKDPFLSPDIKAGATLDLLPLAMGEDKLFVKVPLVQVPGGQPAGIAIHVTAIVPQLKENWKYDQTNDMVLLTITLLEANFLPSLKEAKEGTSCISALGMDKVNDPSILHFGTASSHKDAKRSVWAEVSSLGYAGSTLMSLPEDDIFLPEDLADPAATEEGTEVKSVYWHTMKRIFVNREDLMMRINDPFFVEVAMIPKTGKLEVKARYMAFVDARVLLQPGVCGVTTCAKLMFFNEYELSEAFTPLLDLPPVSAKSTPRNRTNREQETGIVQVTDEYDRHSVVTFRFDLTDPLIPRTKTALLYEAMGYPGASVDQAVPFDELYLEPPPEDPNIDVRRIRKECGAIAVHQELSGLACRGSVPMNQSIKRTAASRLLMRVRTMVKQFMPEPSPKLQWMDTVTSHHAASRHAVTASFTPPPALPRLPPRFAASRSLVGGQKTIENYVIETNLEVQPNHPRSLVLKALSLFEQGEDTEATSFLVKALDSQPRNRFLLWIFGAQQFFKDPFAFDRAVAALRIGVRGDASDGVANTIGWAALHAANHFANNHCAAFIAAKRMRQYFTLPIDWEGFLKRWVDTSGREELYWNPNFISQSNPFLISAAFFLCLRCYNISNVLLCCFEMGCFSRGSGKNLKTKLAVPDVTYLRATSLILRRQYERALKLTDEAVKKLGPSPILSQMRTICLTCERGWDDDCQSALEESERFGIMNSPAVLYQSALNGYKKDPDQALQRAARAHKTYPGPCTALLIGRVYAELGREDLAERWGAVSVKMEPLLTDGWAFLGLLALHARHMNKAHVLLHTARQTGKTSDDIADEIHHLVEVLHADRLPDSLMKKLCVCQTCCSCSQDDMAIMKDDSFCKNRDAGLSTSRHLPHD